MEKHRLEEALEVVAQDVRQTAGVSLGVHLYPPSRKSDTSKYFIVMISGDPAPARFKPGPLANLRGVGGQFSDASSEDALYFVAWAVDEAVQLARWRRGLDPTWPPCPIHDGRHPLRADDHTPDPGTRWACPRRAAPPVGGWPLVGELKPALERWGFPVSPGSLGQATPAGGRRAAS